MRMGVFVPLGTDAGFLRQRHDVKISQPHSALGDDFVGERPHFLHGAPQYRDLQTIPLVDVDVQCRDRQVMVVVLSSRQPPGEIAGLVFIYVSKGRETWSLSGADGLLARYGLAHDIAQCF